MLLLIISKVLFYGESRFFLPGGVGLTGVSRYLLHVVHASFVYCLKEEGQYSISKGLPPGCFLNSKNLSAGFTRFSSMSLLQCGFSQPVTLVCTVSPLIVFPLNDYLGLNLYRLLRAYVYLWMTVGPANYFLDRSRWDNFTHEIISVLTMWLAKFLLVRSLLVCPEG